MHQTRLYEAISMNIKSYTYMNWNGDTKVKNQEGKKWMHWWQIPATNRDGRSGSHGGASGSSTLPY
jgi:hypothetical protein